MKKMKFTAAILAAMLAASTLPVFHGDAYSYCNWAKMSNGLTPVDVDSDAGYILGDGLYFMPASTETYPESTGGLVKVDNFRCNYTMIATDNPDQVLEIYQKYQRALNFNTIETGTALINNTPRQVLRMYELVEDVSDTETLALKQPLIQKFCEEVKEAGLTDSVTYQRANIGGLPFAFEGIHINNFSEDAEAILTDLLEQYYVNPGYDLELDPEYKAQVEKATDPTTQEEYYTIHYITFSTAANIVKAVKEIDPDAYRGCGLMYNMSDNDKTDANSGDIDLLNNEPAFTFGDIDSDNDITTNDAFQTLQYASAAHAGGTPLFTDGTDAYAEASAFAAADVNLDGAADESDAFGILMYTSYRSLGKEATWEEVLNN